RGIACTPEQLVDGSVRCLPADAENATYDLDYAYTSATCTGERVLTVFPCAHGSSLPSVAVIRDDTGCAFVQPPVKTVVTLGDEVPVDAVWTNTSGACTKATPTLARYVRLGAPVDLSTFPLITVGALKPTSGGA